MTDLVERVAQAIYEADLIGQSKVTGYHFKEMAEAAIKAMDEPAEQTRGNPGPEKTCSNCLWSSKFHGQLWGSCRNPQNATVGRAGSDYSSSDVLVPLSVRTNQVCNLHEPQRSSNLREAYEIESYLLENGDSRTHPYQTHWRRKSTSEKEDAE